MTSSLFTSRFPNFLGYSAKTVGLFSSLCLVAYSANALSQARQVPEPQDLQSAAADPSTDLETKLINKEPPYLSAVHIENLISLPRYKLALYGVKQLNKNRQSIIEELKKLCTDPGRDPIIHDCFIAEMSRLLDDKFMCELALKAPGVDTRLFRLEPPSTLQKVRRVTTVSRTYTGLNDDANYNLIFEFLNNYVPELTKQLGKKNVVSVLVKRFSSEVSSFMASDVYTSDLARLNVWATDDLHVCEHEDDEDDDVGFDADTPKQKLKKEFLEWNEWMIMTIAEELAKFNTELFVKLNGLELLILLYEKHKDKLTYLNAIGNCLSLVTLNPSNRQLIIQSGWLRRLHQMSSSDAHNKIGLVRQLIGHKLLCNLEQPLYSPMLYPLSLVDTDSLYQSSNTNTNENHVHVVDVVVVHGLRGSLFRTWRQDSPGPDTEIVASEFDTLEKKILDRLHTLLDEVSVRFSFCWPRDWLGPDLNRKLPDTKFRLIGVNYKSMFSDWELEKFNDKRLKLGIKERAIDIAEQLQRAHVGERPIIWICHSMGGLIVKQLLSHIHEKELKLDRKRLSQSSERHILSNSIVQQTKAIVFLSTPHKGSSIAKTLTNWRFFTSPTTEVVELATDSPYLIDLNKKFLNLVDNHCPWYRILSVCESLDIFQYGQYWRTVTEESANLGLGEFHIAKDKDHLNICKPVNRSCETYCRICSLITETIEKENSTCENCKKERLMIQYRLDKYLFGLFAQLCDF